MMNDWTRKQILKFKTDYPENNYSVIEHGKQYPMEVFKDADGKNADRLEKWLVANNRSIRLWEEEAFWGRRWVIVRLEQEDANAKPPRCLYTEEEVLNYLDKYNNSKSTRRWVKKVLVFVCDMDITGRKVFFTYGSNRKKGFYIKAVAREHDCPYESNLTERVRDRLLEIASA